MTLTLVTETTVHRFGGDLDDPIEKIASFDSRRLGYLRSAKVVTTDDHQARLLAGAQKGLYLSSLDTRSSSSTAFFLPESRLDRRGVNSALLVGTRLFASHSAYGVATWSLNDPRNARPVFDSRAQGVASSRGLQLLPDGDAIFAAGRELLCFDPIAREPRVRVAATLPREVTALDCRSGEWVCGTRDGRLYRWCQRTARPVEIAPRVDHAIYSVRSVLRDGTVRVVTTFREPRVVSLSSDGHSLAEFAAPWQVRWVEADEGRVYAVEDAGRRLAVWSWSNPHEPLGCLALCSRIEAIDEA